MIGLEGSKGPDAPEADGRGVGFPAPEHGFGSMIQCLIRSFQRKCEQDEPKGWPYVLIDGSWWAVSKAAPMIPADG